jgi:hypothetical protein
MRRRGPLLPLVAGLLLLAPAGAQAAQSKCEKLRGDDLAPSSKVKLVERNTTDPDTGGEVRKLVGCVLPDGKVRTVAAREEVGNTSDDYRLREVDGRYVLVDEITRTAFFRRRETIVSDLKQGDRYVVASRCKDFGEQGDFCGSTVGEFAARAAINSRGQAAAVVWSANSDLATVEGFSSSGRRVVFDTGTRGEIPASSLHVDRHRAHWTNSGASMSHRLPRRSACEKLDGDQDLAPAKDTKLVKRRNSDNGTDLVGCVLPSGIVRTVSSSVKLVAEERGYKLLQVAHHQVLVRGEVRNQYGHGLSTYVFDLEDGTTYTIAETCFDAQGVACDQTKARRAFVNASGQAAAVVSTAGSQQLKVMGFASTGDGTVFDTGTATQIPPSSLSLQGHVVRWMHSGHPRSATLSG